jgi:hypothetical protein
MIQKKLFKMLARVNRIILPSLSRRDISRLSPLEKALVAYRYWVTRNALD